MPSSCRRLPSSHKPRRRHQRGGGAKQSRRRVTKRVCNRTHRKRFGQQGAVYRPRKCLTFRNRGGTNTNIVDKPNDESVHELVTKLFDAIKQTGHKITFENSLEFIKTEYRFMVCSKITPLFKRLDLDLTQLLIGESSTPDEDTEGTANKNPLCDEDTAEVAQLSSLSNVQNLLNSSFMLRQMCNLYSLVGYFRAAIRRPKLLKYLLTNKSILGTNIKTKIDTHSDEMSMFSSLISSEIIDMSTFNDTSLRNVRTLYPIPESIPEEVINVFRGNLPLKTCLCEQTPQWFQDLQDEHDNLRNAFNDVSSKMQHTKFAGGSISGQDVFDVVCCPCAIAYIIVAIVVWCLTGGNVRLPMGK